MAVAASGRGPGGPACRTGEPVDEDGDEDQVEQVVERLRREVVLPDPVADAEEEGGQPLSPPGDVQPAHEEEEHRQAGQVDGDWPDPHQPQETVNPRGVGHECDEREEAWPAEVGGQAWGGMTGLADVVDEPGDLVGRCEPRFGLGEDRDSVQADDQSDEQGGQSRQQGACGETARRRRPNAMTVTPAMAPRGSTEMRPSPFMPARSIPRSDTTNSAKPATVTAKRNASGAQVGHDRSPAAADSASEPGLGDIVDRRHWRGVPASRLHRHLSSPGLVRIFPGRPAVPATGRGRSGRPQSPG